MRQKNLLGISRNDNDIVKKLMMKYNPQLLDSAVGPEDGSHTQRYAHQPKELLNDHDEEKS